MTNEERLEKIKHHKAELEELQLKKDDLKNQIKAVQKALDKQLSKAELNLDEVTYNQMIDYQYYMSMALKNKKLKEHIDNKISELGMYFGGVYPSSNNRYTHSLFINLERGEDLDVIINGIKTIVENADYNHDISQYKQPHHMFYIQTKSNVACTLHIMKRGGYC